METNNALNQNPEETKKTVQEENSNPAKEAKEQKAKPSVKKSKSTKPKEEKVEKKKTSTVKAKPVGEVDASEESKTQENSKEQPEPEEIETGQNKDQVVHEDSSGAEEEKTLVTEKLKEKASEKTENQSDQLEALNIAHDDEEEDEEEDEHHEDQEKGLPINYDKLSIDALVALLEEIVQEEEIATLRKNVALIKVAFLKKHKAHQEENLESVAGHKDDDEVTEVEDELGKRFNKAFHVYSAKRKAYQKQLEIEKQQNLETKKLILEELKALIESEESLKKTYDDFKELQEKWKAIGMVPKGEVNNLWQNYHFYVEKFFDKVKINKELRDLDLKKKHGNKN